MKVLVGGVQCKLGGRNRRFTALAGSNHGRATEAGAGELVHGSRGGPRMDAETEVRDTKRRRRLPRCCDGELGGMFDGWATRCADDW